MIKVIYKKNNDLIESINISGHAKYDEYGKDIVCAGVSASLITSINAILKFDKNAISYTEGNTFSLKNIKKDNITNIILENFILILKEMEESYKENINIKEE